MTKTIAFRPTEKSLAIVTDYLKEHNIKKTARAINAILEQYQQPMPEGFTGQLIDCPMRPYSLCAECSLCEGITIKTPVDSSVCKTCLKYPCETWENIESERRIA